MLRVVYDSDAAPGYMKSRQQTRQQLVEALHNGMRGYAASNAWAIQRHSRLLPSRT